MWRTARTASHRQLWAARPLTRNGDEKQARQSAAVSGRPGGQHLAGLDVDGAQMAGTTAVATAQIPILNSWQLGPARGLSAPSGQERCCERSTDLLGSGGRLGRLVGAGFPAEGNVQTVP